MIKSKQNLAIVIPAYKSDFLKITLDSISKQTNKTFTIYIGDDNSPYNLKNIVDEFKNRIPISYKRFPQNIGMENLAEHWNRCVELVQREEWVWLFSDDDEMDPECVNTFFKFCNSCPNMELFHFDVRIINAEGLVVKECMEFPINLNVSEFIKIRLTQKSHSFAVNYIFKREVFLREGKFQSFDLAWGTDDATWIKFGREKGIYSISGPKVSWRLSNSNISSFVKDYEMLRRKSLANIDYLKWLIRYCKEMNIHDTTTIFDKMRWSINQIKIRRFLTIFDQVKFILNFCKEFKCWPYSVYGVFYLILYRAYFMLLKKTT